MQMQMFVTGIKQCDFYVWTESKNLQDKTFKLRVNIDEEFCKQLLRNMKRFSNLFCCLSWLQEN